MDLKMRILDSIRACRDWLNRNQVFFQTIAAVLLSIMAIFVTLQTNQIVSYQTKLMEAEQVPHLDFNLEMVYNSSENEFCRDQLTISNSGSPLREFSVVSYVLLVLSYANYTERSFVEVPISMYGYYTTSASTYTNNPSGELAILTNYNISEVNYWLANLVGGKYLNRSEVNYWLANQTVNGFFDIAQEKYYFSYASIYRYFFVTYRDKMEKLHYEHYVVRSDGSFRKISEDSFDEMWNNYFLNRRYREGKIVTSIFN
jgi:hypothetical protein